MTNKLEDWKVLYDTFFGIKIDTSKLALPKERDGFNQLIIVPEGLKIQQVYDILVELFRCCRKYTGESLDEIVTRNDREPKETYAIRVRDRVEADAEFSNMSANDLEKKGHAGITLLERLLLELFYFWKTGGHLDEAHITLCSGSRGSDGDVPYVVWSGDGPRVSWFRPAFADWLLRSREVVTT